MDTLFTAIIKVQKHPKKQADIRSIFMDKIVHHSVQKIHVVKATSEDDAATKVKKFYSDKDDEHHSYKVIVVDIEPIIE